MAGKKSIEKPRRARGWVVIVYPDSAPENWRSILDEMMLEWIESPLHDKDVNPDGEPKKPHWHVLILFGGLKSFDQVVDLLKPLNCPIPQICQNARSAVRYMSHMDNPDKAQYPSSKIIAHGGVDLAELLRPSSSKRLDILREIVAFIDENEITEFQDIAAYAALERDDWFDILANYNTLFITSYLKSARHRAKPKVRIDLERKKLGLEEDREKSNDTPDKV